MSEMNRMNEENENRGYYPTYLVGYTMIQKDCLSLLVDGGELHCNTSGYNMVGTYHNSLGAQLTSKWEQGQNKDKLT